MSKEIGLKLKQERVSKKLTIDDVASRLKIRKFYLEAIEAGNFKELPGITYAVGFIRSYAKLLGIDPEPMVEVLKGEKIESSTSTNIGLATAHMESALPSRWVIIVPLVILVIAYLVWYKLSRTMGVADDIPSAEAPAVIIDRIKIEEVPEPVAAEKNAVQVPSSLPPASEPVEETASETEVQKLSVTTVVESEPLPRIAEEIRNRSYGAETTGAKIVVTATEDSWIQVRKGEELIFSKVLLAGDKYYVRDYSNDLVMDTGNAGGIYITVNGSRIRVLGPRGVVVRDFLLSKENLDEYAGQ